MLDPNRAEIESLKARWRELILAHQQQEKLIDMLKEVETLLLKLETDLTRTPRAAGEPHIEEKQQLYHQLSQKKHELDLLLDKVEGIASGDIQATQEELVKRLLEYDPQLAQSYGSLHQKLVQLFKKEQNCYTLMLALDKIHFHLKTILQVRQKATGWGMWRHLFQPSPTSQIGMEIEKLSGIVSLLLQSGKYSEEITLFLQQLNGLCKQRWDYALIDNHYAPLLESALFFHEQCHHTLAAMRKEKADVRERLIEWIERV